MKLFAISITILSLVACYTHDDDDYYDDNYYPPYYNTYTRVLDSTSKYQEIVAYTYRTEYRGNVSYDVILQNTSTSHVYSFAYQLQLFSMGDVVDASYPAFVNDLRPLQAYTGTSLSITNSQWMPMSTVVFADVTFYQPGIQ